MSRPNWTGAPSPTEIAQSITRYQSADAYVDRVMAGPGFRCEYGHQACATHIGGPCSTEMQDAAERRLRMAGIRPEDALSS